MINRLSQPTFKASVNTPSIAFTGSPVTELAKPLRKPILKRRLRPTYPSGASTVIEFIKLFGPLGEQCAKAWLTGGEVNPIATLGLMAAFKPAADAAEHIVRRAGVLAGCAWRKNFREYPVRLEKALRQNDGLIRWDEHIEPCLKRLKIGAKKLRNGCKRIVRSVRTHTSKTTS